MQPTVGRIVHAVITREMGFNLDPSVPYQCRAAVIVRAWNTDMVNLQILFDGTNDDPTGDGKHVLSRWETSVRQSVGTDEGRTWHDPRECPYALNAHSGSTG